MHLEARNPLWKHFNSAHSYNVLIKPLFPSLRFQKAPAITLAASALFPLSTHIWWEWWGSCIMQKSSCAWDVAFKAMFVQRSHRCMCWPEESSPGNPLGSCLDYHFRNILGSFNILKLNLCCCSLHSGFPRNSTSVENPDKPMLREPPFPRAETLVYLWRALWAPFYWC